MNNDPQPKESQTPWRYDEQRYAKLVNLSGDLKFYGWIMLSIALMIGLAMIISELKQVSHSEKIVSVSFGFIFIFIGTIAKVIWHVVSEVIKLFIDIANDVSGIRLK